MDAIETYLNEVRRRLDAAPMQKEAVVTELRSHLWEKVRDLEARRPGTAPETIIREVLADFGQPAAVASAYGPMTESPPTRSDPRRVVLELDGRIVDAAARARDVTVKTAERTKRGIERGGRWLRKKAPGVARILAAVWHLIASILLFVLNLMWRIIAWIGRVLGVTVRWTALILLVIVTTALVALTFTGLFLFDEVTATVASQQQARVLDVREDCWSAACTFDVPSAGFYVGPAAERVTFRLYAQPADGAMGTFDLTIRDASGYPLVVRTLDGRSASSVDETHRWVAQDGLWMASYAFDDFQGVVYLRADVRGV